VIPWAARAAVHGSAGRTPGQKKTRGPEAPKMKGNMLTDSEINNMAALSPDERERQEAALERDIEAAEGEEQLRQAEDLAHIGGTCAPDCPYCRGNTQAAGGLQPVNQSGRAPA